MAPAILGGTVRQAALSNPGSEYTLAGTPTGIHYDAIADTYDATSDGTWIYGWDWANASLVRYNSNWQSPQTLFSLGANYNDNFMGITYDLRNNSIWLAPWAGAPAAVRGRLYDYSLQGQQLGTLPLANAQAFGNGLAYDAADNTLWFFSWTDQRYEQYSMAGTLLSNMTGMTRIYGAEFAVVPEPSAAALFALAGLVLGAFRALLRLPRSMGFSTEGDLRQEEQRGLVAETRVSVLRYSVFQLFRWIGRAAGIANLRFEISKRSHGGSFRQGTPKEVIHC
jgi:hypothetical protein